MSLILLFTGAVMIVGAVVIASRGREDMAKFERTRTEVTAGIERIESDLRRFVDEADSIQSKLRALDAQMQAQAKRLDEFDTKVMRLDDKIGAVDLQSKMPRTLNVRMSEPVRVGIVYRKSAPAAAPKKVKEASKLDQSRQKLIKSVRKKMQELDQ